MGRLRRAVAALRRGERGFTLIELLVAAGIGLVVIGGAMTIFISAVRSEPRNGSKVAAIQQGRFVADRIVRELRQGLEVPATPSASHLEIVTYVKAASCGGAAASTAIPCRVIYDCEGDSCTRAVAQPDGTGESAAVQVAEGLTGAEVFAYVPSAAEPAYVTVTLSFESDGAPVVISDGAAPRNPEGV